VHLTRPRRTRILFPSDGRLDAIRTAGQVDPRVRRLVDARSSAQLAGPEDSRDFGCTGHAGRTE
jgi:hypothetical protein